MNYKLKIGVILFLLILISISILPIFLPSPYEIEIDKALAKPTLEHIAGCDVLGRDLLSRTLVGGRTSISIAFLSSSLSLLLGALLGILSVTSLPLSRVIIPTLDLLKSVPSTLLALLFMSLLGPGALDLILALTLVNIPQSAYLARSRMLLINKEEYTLSRLTQGLKPSTMVKGYLRHLAPVLLVQFVFIFASSILAEAALSFIGAGILPPTPSLGNILSEGRSAIFTSSHILIAPSLAIFLTVLSLNLIHEGLQGET